MPPNCFPLPVGWQHMLAFLACTFFAGTFSHRNLPCNIRLAAVISDYLFFLSLYNTIAFYFNSSGTHALSIKNNHSPKHNVHQMYWRNHFTQMRISKISSQTFYAASAYDHITLNTPVLVRSPKLSNVEWSQYLDG
jgi:hypothetical protein